MQKLIGQNTVFVVNYANVFIFYMNVATYVNCPQKCYLFLGAENTFFMVCIKNDAKVIQKLSHFHDESFLMTLGFSE